MKNNLKNNLERLIRILSDDLLEQNKYDAIVETCQLIFNDRKKYNDKFWNDNYDESEDDSWGSEFANSYSNSSMLIYELVFNEDLSWLFSWGEDTLTIHSYLVESFDGEIPDYPENENYDLDEYKQFLIHQVLPTINEYVIYEFIETLPTQDESTIFVAIKNKFENEFELIVKEFGFRTEKVE